MKNGFDFARPSRAIFSCLGLLMALASCPSPAADPPAAGPPAAPASTPDASGGKKPAIPPPPPQPIPDALPRVPELLVSVEPSSTTVSFKESETTLWLVLTNLSPKEQKFHVDLGVLPLKTGNVAAHASFPNDGGEFAEPVLKGLETKRLMVKVAGLTHLGLYEGLARVRTTVPSATETVRPMSVLRQAPNYDLTFSGPDLVNGVLTLKPKSVNDRVFSFVVENSRLAGNASVGLKVATTRFSGKQPIALSVEPPTLKMTPGDTQLVTLTVGAEPVAFSELFSTDFPTKFRAWMAQEDLPPSGDYLARLSFGEEGGATKHLEVRLQPSFVPGKHLAVIIILVSVGALLSALVGAAIPNIVASSRLRGRIEVMRDRLARLPSAEQASKAALAQELQEVDAAIHAASWYTPSAADRLTAQMAKATELEQRVKQLVQVSEQRTILKCSRTLPTSSRAQWATVLDLAAADIAAANPGASERLLAAKQGIAAAPVAVDVLAAIDAVIPLLPPPVSGLPGQDAVMVSRLAAIPATRTGLSASSSMGTLLQLDYECQCAHSYFVEYLQQILPLHPAPSDVALSEADLLKLLKADEFAWVDAMTLLGSLRLGVSRATMDTAVSDLEKNASVQVDPPQPKEGEVASFRLVFNTPELNRSPLLHEREFNWTFTLGEPMANGPVVSQFIPTRSLREKLIFAIKRKDPPRLGYSVKAEMPSQKIANDLQTVGDDWWSSVKLQADFVSFAVVLVGAIVLALVMNFAEAKPLDSMKDYLNPFLLGFGLDRMKALVGATRA